MSYEVFGRDERFAHHDASITSASADEPDPHRCAYCSVPRCTRHKPGCPRARRRMPEPEPIPPYSAFDKSELLRVARLIEDGWAAAVREREGRKARSAGA